MGESRSPWLRVWAAFLGGATRPSLAGLVATLSVSAGLIAAAAVKLTPDYLAELDLPFYLVKPDWNTRATLGTFRASRREAHPHAVGVFGASAQLQAMGTSEEATAAFSAVKGSEVPVDMLCSAGITLPEMLAQIEYSQAAFPGAVVIGISSLKLWSSPEFQPELMRLGLVEPRHPTGIYLFDQWAFLTPRIEYTMRRWLRYATPFVRRVHPVRPPRRGPIPFKPFTETDYEEELLERTRRFDQSFAHYRDPKWGLGTLKQTLEDLRGNGRVVVLLESVLNPRLRANLDPAGWADYAAFMTALAEEHGAYYWDLSEVLVEEDFSDLGHVGAPGGRQRYTQALADRLAPLLGTGGEGASE